MMEQEMSTLWKTEIEKTLTQLQPLRDQLNPVPFSSPLWEEYRGAYGDVREDVAFLFCPKEILPEMEKIIRLDFEDKADDTINLDNLCENLSHQMSFYDATYLAMPYLALLFELKKQQQDFEGQYLLICQAGMIFATDLPCDNGKGSASLPPEIQTSYQQSKTLFQKMTQEFLEQNMEQLKQKESGDLQFFCTSLLAILKDPQAAYQLVVGSWEQVCVECPSCEYYDEDMESEGFYNPEIVKARVAPVGQDLQEPNKSTYQWLCDLFDAFGIEDAWKLPYYYGTYTCPECGEQGILMDWMKNNI